MDKAEETHSEEEVWITFISYPKHAGIFIDGKWVGNTNVHIAVKMENNIMKKHIIEIKYPGYKPHIIEGELASDNSYKVEVTLESSDQEEHSLMNRELNYWNAVQCFLMTFYKSQFPGLIPVDVTADTPYRNFASKEDIVFEEMSKLSGYQIYFKVDSEVIGYVFVFIKTSTIELYRHMRGTEWEKDIKKLFLMLCSVLSSTYHTIDDINPVIGEISTIDADKFKIHYEGKFKQSQKIYNSSLIVLSPKQAPIDGMVAHNNDGYSNG
ncbi:MAG: PEGA domain-containing protein [Nitrospirae bacterium]|nr:PEGA domain-containing protein [Nitrospirota bacterium]